MGRLDGRVALVTGAASGIGRGTASLFAAEGAQVVALDIDGDGVAETVRAITQAGGRAVAGSLDVTREDRWEAAMALALDTFGKLNIVCNIAGIGAMSDFETLTLEHWNRELAVNLTGVFLGCKHGVRTIKLCGEPGAIVNLGSISALRGVPVQAAYNASKAGVCGLTKAVALDCAKKAYGIRCNAVHPSYVDTSIFDPFVGNFADRATMLAEFSKDVPIGRVSTPDDIARVILFLSTEDSAMMTGADVVVDGGHTIGIPTRFEG